MKVLLVHPPINPSVVGAGIFYMGEPLALETVAASMSDHDVRALPGWMLRHPPLATGWASLGNKNLCVSSASPVATHCLSGSRSNSGPERRSN